MIEIGKFFHQFDIKGYLLDIEQNHSSIKLTGRFEDYIKLYRYIKYVYTMYNIIFSICNIHKFSVEFRIS